MEEIIEKIILAGLGAISITREKAEKIVQDLVQKGEIAKEEQPEFVKKLLERSKLTRKEIEDIIEESVANVLHRMNIPTKSDINALVDRIEALEKKIKKR